MDGVGMVESWGEFCISFYPSRRSKQDLEFGTAVNVERWKMLICGVSGGRMSVSWPSLRNMLWLLRRRLLEMRVGSRHRLSRKKLRYGMIPEN